MKKPTIKRCALKAHHEGPHQWVITRRLGQFGECRTLWTTTEEWLALTGVTKPDDPETSPVAPPGERP